MLVDYILVGQGIAGSCLAYELMQRACKVVVFDESHKSAACLVAAGVINPITGKRLVKSWRSELAHPYAMQFYASLEKSLGGKFFHSRKILQICRSTEEDELWQERLKNPDYVGLIGKHNPVGSFPLLKDSYGSYFIERSAWVECPALIKSFDNFFEKSGVLYKEKFDYSKLEILQDSVKYKEFEAKKLVFCEGWRVSENPYFNWLPYRAAKGEILTIRSDAVLPDHILHRGNWIMKINDTFRIGSTWEREKLDDTLNESAKQELLEAAKYMLPFAKNFEVCDHTSGIRPCTATTRPHFGEHPKYKNLLSFNGFGSKGFALSPYFAKEFASYMIEGNPIYSEANLARHIKKFYKE